MAKTNHIVVKCRTCSWATLIQLKKGNPLLAECKCKNPEEREVANAERTCPFYLINPTPNPTIHHYEDIHARRAATSQRTQ